MGAVDGAAVEVQVPAGAQLGEQELVRAGQTPALVQSRSRRQQVAPEHWGRAPATVSVRYRTRLFRLV
jgi:hypothetical protein